MVRRRILLPATLLRSRNGAKVGAAVFAPLMVRTFDESGGLHGPRLVLDAPKYPHAAHMGNALTIIVLSTRALAKRIGSCTMGFHTGMELKSNNNTLLSRYLLGRIRSIDVELVLCYQRFVVRVFSYLDSFVLIRFFVLHIYIVKRDVCWTEHFFTCNDL